MKDMKGSGRHGKDSRRFECLVLVDWGPNFHLGVKRRSGCGYYAVSKINTFVLSLLWVLSPLGYLVQKIQKLKELMNMIE